MRHFHGSFTKCLATVLLGFFLSACGGGGDSEGSRPDSVDIVSTLSGSIGDGPISGATIKVIDKNGKTLLTKQNSTTSFDVTVKSPGKSYPLTIEAFGGIDLVSNMAPDFTLVTAVLKPKDKNNANINPYSTMIVKTALAMGGVNKANIETATNYVRNTLNFGLDSAHIADPISTRIDASNISIMVKSSEAFGEMIRRTHAALTSAGVSVTFDKIVSALAADLSDGVIDGAGASGVNARISAMVKVVSGQVLLESLTNDLKVNGIDATAAMDNAILAIDPNIPASSLTDSVRVADTMIAHARLAVEAAKAIAPATGLDDVSGRLATIPVNSASGNIAAFDATLLNDAIMAVGSADAVQLTMVNNTNSINTNNPPTNVGNRAPTANAGQDQTVTSGNPVSLSGSGFDADGDSLTYRWNVNAQPTGSVVVLSGASNINTQFTPEVPGQYELSLVVNDGSVNSAPDSAIITVEQEISDCGPAYDPGSERAVFIWQDCTTGEWHTRMTPGGQFTTHTGRLIANQPFGTVSPYENEADDFLDWSTNPKQIDFALLMSGAGEDGFSFTIPANVEVCFEPSAPSSVPVYVGAARKSVTAPFNLTTLGSCSAPPPSLFINDITVSETDAAATFTVSLSGASSSSVRVDVASQNGSATAPADYSTLPLTTMTFSPGEISKTVSVAIVDDNQVEDTKNFSVRLSNPVNATLGDNTGIGTILDSDVAFTPGWKEVWREDFNGDGLLPKGVWTYERGFLRNSEAQYYADPYKDTSVAPTVFKKNGVLKIQGRKESYGGGE